MLWIKDPVAWGRLDLPDKLDALRAHYCTGPSGQSSSVQSTRGATEDALKTAAVHLRELYREAKWGW